MNKDNIFNEIECNWYSLGKLVNETTITNNWRPGQTALAEWLLKITKETGLNQNTIGRMLSVYEFICKIAPSEANEQKAERYPFSSLEILQRIHAIDPSQTHSLLEAISNKKISMRDLRLKLKTIQSEQPEERNFKRSTTIRNIKDFEKYALFTLHESLSEFEFPEQYVFAVMSNKSRNNQFQIPITIPDALVFDKNSINKTSTGFEIHHSGSEKVDLQILKMRLIERCCYMCSFLSKLYLVLPSSVNRETAQNIADTFTHTGRLNVGVALLRSYGDRTLSEDKSTNNYIFLSRPIQNAEPAPDCRNIVDWNQYI